MSKNSLNLVHEKFTAAARSFPDQLAVTEETGLHHLTYADLDERSTYLANRLLLQAGSSLAENPYIGVLVQRGIGMVVALLAILNTGAAYVPVDPSFPKDRQAYIFSHSRCSLLIVDEGTLVEAGALAQEAAEQFSPTLFTIDRDSGYPIDEDESAQRTIGSSVLKAAVELERPIAYVLYTSGSTGKPKGVMVYHDSVVNTLEWFAQDLGLTPQDRVLGLTTYCFDISVLEMFMPLLCGAGLVIASSASQKDPFRLVKLLTDQQITVMQATPTTYEMCLAVGWKGDPTIQFLVGGEAFRPKLKEIVRNCRSLRNVYGPTGT